MRPHHVVALSLFALLAVGCTPEGEETTEPDSDAGGQGDDASSAEPDAADVGEARTLGLFLSSEKFETTAGLAGLDGACGQDAKASAGATYKALIASPSRLPTNAACEAPQVGADWPLVANTTYQNEDGDVLFTTNASAIYVDWPMDNAFSDSGINFASGMDDEWCVIPDRHCEDWTSGDGEAAVGWTASDDGGLFKGGFLGCGRLYVVCVEQP